MAQSHGLKREIPALAQHSGNILQQALEKRLHNTPAWTWSI
jgi:hypothetical protein